MIGNGTLVEIITYFVGNPQDEMQSFVIYLGATTIYVIIILMIVYLIKVIGQSLNRN
jgi:ABC-type amino acid transport system permease subunit